MIEDRAATVNAWRRNMKYKWWGKIEDEKENIWWFYHKSIWKRGKEEDSTHVLSPLRSLHCCIAKCDNLCDL